MIKSKPDNSTTTAIARASLAGGVMTLAIIATQAAPGGAHPTAAPQATSVAKEQPASRFSANGFELVSETLVLPEEVSEFPAGAGSDVAVNNCTACHSASMALTQPPLSDAQWTAIVEKMRNVYHANVAAGDVSQIVAYLRTLPGQAGGLPTEKPSAQQSNTGADSG